MPHAARAFNSAEYSRLLRKVERESIYKDFSSQIETLLFESAPPKDTAVFEFEERGQAKRIFIEFQIISLKEEIALTKENLDELVNIWKFIFPDLSVRLSHATYVSATELNHIKKFIDVLNKQMTVWNAFRQFLNEEMTLSSYRLNEIPLNPEYTPGIIASEMVVGFCDPVVSLEISFIKE